MVRFWQLVILLPLACADENKYEEAFKIFMKKYDKVYTDETEKEMRFAIFKKSYDYVEVENAKDHSYSVTLNEFADQLPVEMKSTHLGLNMPPAGKLFGEAPYLGMDTYSGAALPTSVDWTQKGAVTPPKNQASCGSCWAFSSTGALEGAWQIATGNLVSFSEQQLVDCTKGSPYKQDGCHGGSMDVAFQYFEKNAVCTEASYKYTAKDGTCQAQDCQTGIPQGGVTGYKSVTEDDENALMEAVVKQPVSIAIEADQQAFQLYNGGILTKACGDKLDHGVLLVGYGTEGGTDYWKVKNSWGASWGEQGYIRMERGSKNNAPNVTDGNDGECGILSQPLYPVVQGKPGPTPPPSPPTPPSPTPPTPTPPVPPPSHSHYEQPPCQSDEVEAKIEQIGGVVCAPKCHSTSDCPTDLPPGTRATPLCGLRDPSGDMYCALVCKGQGCPHGAKCAKLGETGICVYPSTHTSSTNMTLSEQSTFVI